MNDVYESDSDELDQEKLKRMLKRAYNIERENTKTGSKTDKKMKEELCTIIEEEAKKCY